MSSSHAADQPTPPPAPARGRVLPEPDWGWPTGVSRVEVERVTARGETYAVDRVTVDGSVLGCVVGRPETRTGRRWWDHVPGPGAEADATSARVQTRLVYPTASRQHAVGALIEAVRRNETAPAAGGWAMFAGRREHDGQLVDLGTHPAHPRMHGHTDIVPVTVAEDATGPYWGWLAAGEDTPVMIYEHETLFRICFPYGVDAEVAAGRGRVVRLTVTESSP